MHITLQTFRLPKEGNADAENEDAAWPDADAEYDILDVLPSAIEPAPTPARQTDSDGAKEERSAAAVRDNDSYTLRVAVADGATETLFSGLWARQLTRAYCNSKSDRAFLQSLPALRADWQRDVASRPLPWYAEEKARAGAFATLLGLTLKTGHAQGIAYYQTLAIGDSCLFHLRAARLLRAFPLTRAAEFNNSPYLLASHPQRNPDLEANLLTRAHRAVPGDTLLLLTDAIAQWYLRTLETDPDAPDPLHAIAAPNAFAALVRQEREAHRLRNDDTTLLRLTLAASRQEPGTP